MPGMDKSKIHVPGASALQHRTIAMLRAKHGDGLRGYLSYELEVRAVFERKVWCIDEKGRATRLIED